jgi:hypothetical protein
MWQTWIVLVDQTSDILSLCWTLDVDDWLKTVEKKLQVVQCNNRETVLFVAHQLFRPAVDWWDVYVEAHEEPKIMN